MQYDEIPEVGRLPEQLAEEDGMSAHIGVCL